MPGRMLPGRGRTLAERVAAALPDLEPDAEPVAEPTPGPASEPPGVRHCWVDDPPEAAGRWPALLLSWSRSGASWRGRVVYAYVRAGEVVLVEAELDAGHLSRR